MASKAELAILITGQNLAGKALDEVNQGLGGLGRVASGAVDGLGKLGLAGLGIQSVAGAARGLGETLGLGLANEMEQVRASIGAFTKDSALTEQVLQQVRTEANKTPFAFQEMATATAALMPVAKGAKVDLMALVKEAEILAASNPLQGLEGASFSLREAMTGDFTSIIERFNLSRSTIKALKDEGVSNLDIVRRAMQEMGFDSDLIAAKAQTLSGRWSTFTDTLDTVKLRLAEPIFEVLKDALTGLQGLLDDNETAITTLAESLAAGLANAFKTLRTAIGQIFSGDIKGALATFTTYLGEVGSELTAQLGTWSRAFLDWIGPLIPPFLETLRGLATEMLDWIIEQGPPFAEKFLSEWVPAALVWVGQVAIDIIPKLLELVLAIGTWIVAVGAPKLLEFALKLGAAIISGMVKALEKLGVALMDAIGNAVRSINLDFGWIRITGAGVAFNIPMPSIPMPNLTLPGFQHGGSFSVAGSGGVDSQLVAFRATPGEQVAVTSPGRAAAAGAEPAVVIQGDVVLQVDRRELARITREELLRLRVSRTSLGLA